MSAEPYKVHPDSELSALLDRAEHEPLVLENVKNGKRFRLAREAEDVWAGYDPDAALAGMNTAAGSIPVAEAERIKRLIYEGREQGSRPASRSRLHSNFSKCGHVRPYVSKLGAEHTTVR